MPKPNFQLVIDTREQDELVFPSREIQTVREALDAGDYGIKIEGELQQVRIERKSTADCFSSFSGDNYRREKLKIQRAMDTSLRYIIAVEASCSKVREGYRYYKQGQWHQVQKDGLTQIRQLETISMKYGVELRYCAGRDDMAFMVQEILLAYVRAWEQGLKAGGPRSGLSQKSGAKSSEVRTKEVSGEGS